MRLISVYGVEWHVAQQAACEELGGRQEIECGDDLCELLEGRVGHDLDRLRWSELAEEIAVSRQQDPVIVDRALHDQRIRRVDRKLKSVGADDAQPSPEPAEHRIGEETNIGDVHRMMDVPGLGHRTGPMTKMVLPKGSMTENVRAPHGSSRGGRVMSTRARHSS